MPTATKFEAEEIYNGFPFCVRKVDIQPLVDSGDLTHWTTFSGYTGTAAATEAQIYESFRLAVKLYWNSETLNCSTETYESTSGSYTNTNVAIDKEPRERVCGYNDIQVELAGGTAARCSIRVRPKEIYMLYYGNNFLGYGSTIPLNGYVSPLTGWYESNKIQYPGGDIQLLGGAGPPSDPTDPHDIAVVSVSGIYFVCYVDCQPVGVYTLDAGNMYMKISFTVSGTLISEVTQNISSLDFFSYT